MIPVDDIATWLDLELDAERFRAKEPENGLLLDSGNPVERLTSAVNTTFETIAGASAVGAALLDIALPATIRRS